ncbi:hypothetical protein Scep_019442 [Stephania cephalantha]|uniref:Uncharacterized protein n=1 Tax=Stephania cephalantha TaxID=152367 RepID=A0AAP0NM54_9MAGN
MYYLEFYKYDPRVKKSVAFEYLDQYFITLGAIVYCFSLLFYCSLLLEKI